MCLWEETLFEEDAHLLVEGGNSLSGTNEGRWNWFAEREEENRCGGRGVREIATVKRGECSKATAQPASEIGVWLMMFISPTEDDFVDPCNKIK